MSQPKQIEKVTKPDHILSYFKLELWPLLLVTVSGIFYNVGMIAGPYFEGRLAQCLFDIMNGYQTFSAMISLAVTYLAVILAVQLMRCIKRFYVRRFANDTSRNMRHMLYNSLVNMSQEELKQESLGAIMTKAVTDVDACVEGMRKFPRKYLIPAWYWHLILPCFLFMTGGWLCFPVSLHPLPISLQGS